MYASANLVLRRRFGVRKKRHVLAPFIPRNNYVNPSRPEKKISIKIYHGVLHQKSKRESARGVIKNGGKKENSRELYISHKLT